MHDPNHGRNHPVDPYSAEVAEIRARLKTALCEFAKTRPWAHTADLVDPFGIATAAIVISRLPRDPKENPRRLAVQRLEKFLCAERADVAEQAAASGFDAEVTVGMLEQYDRDLAKVRSLLPSWPSPIVFIAQSVCRAFECANRDAKLRSELCLKAQQKFRPIPLGFGANGVVVEMIYQALEDTHLKYSKESIRIELRKLPRRHGERKTPISLP